VTGQTTRPFRWNIAKREQLGRLVEGEAEVPYVDFVQDLQQCCARIISFLGDAHATFVGRSPECIFDHLSGLLADSTWKERMTLFNISMSGWWPGSDMHRKIGSTRLREQLTAMELSPESLIARKNAVAFVDLVSSGGTFTQLNRAIFEWVSVDKLDEAAVRAKVRFIGITGQEKTSPNTWRWQQPKTWTQSYRSDAIKNVSIPGRLWDFLGNYGDKATPSNPPWRWGSSAMAQPPTDECHRRALRLALKLYELGLQRDTRLGFTKLLARQPGMDQAQFRSLITELRKRK